METLTTRGVVAFIAVVMSMPVVRAQTAQTPNGTEARPRSSTGAAADYRLAPGDKLRVEVYKDAQLSQSLQELRRGHNRLAAELAELAKHTSVYNASDGLVKHFFIHPHRPHAHSPIHGILRPRADDRQLWLVHVGLLAIGINRFRVGNTRRQQHLRLPQQDLG